MGYVTNLRCFGFLVSMLHIYTSTPLSCSTTLFSHLYPSLPSEVSPNCLREISGTDCGCIIAFDQLFRLRPVGGGDIAFSNALLFPRWLPVATECLGHGNSGYKMRWRAPLFDCKPPPSAIHFISHLCHATTALLSTPTSEPSPSWKAVPRVTVCSV